MFLPLYDENPLRVIPFQRVTVSLIILCTLIFLYQNQLALGQAQAFALGFGMVPALLFGHGVLPAGLERLPPEATLLTSVFLHGDWPHLIGNMLFLWVFGDNVEDAMGHIRFLVFFLVCGMLAAFTHGLVDPFAVKPLIGASGAVAGVMGAYVMLHPRVKILILAFNRLPFRLPAYVILGAWLTFQMLLPIVADKSNSIAWWAHIAGFVAGAILIIPFRRAGLPLFDRGVAH